MLMYLWILIWTGVTGVFVSTGKLNRTEMVNGESVRRIRPLFAFLIFLPLIIWTGYRGIVGDTWVYMQSYNTMPSTLSGIPEYFVQLSKDKGFYIGASLIKCTIGNNVNLYFIILALIQTFFLIRMYRKYSSHFVLCFFLFIASTDYISWMFNGIRQFTAVTIVFGCFELILKKKYVSVIIIILLASTVHGTALLMLPFIFICQGKAWNKKTMTFLVLVIITIAFIGNFTSLLDTMLEDTQYQNVVSDWTSINDDGTNIFRVLVYSVPAILSWVGRKKIWSENNPVINLCTNMSIVATGFYIVSIFTSGIFIGRLPIYFSLYSYILLPWELDYMFTKQSSKIMKVMLVTGYLLFYAYSMRNMGII